MSANGGYPAPGTYVREQRPHSCGRCRNPFTGGREDCPNNVLYVPRDWTEQ